MGSVLTRPSGSNCQLLRTGRVRIRHSRNQNQEALSKEPSEEDEAGKMKWDGRGKGEDTVKMYSKKKYCPKLTCLFFMVTQLYKF